MKVVEFKCVLWTPEGRVVGTTGCLNHDPLCETIAQFYIVAARRAAEGMLQRMKP